MAAFFADGYFRKFNGGFNALISAGRFSAYQMACGSNPIDLIGWDDQGEDLMFAQDTSLSGQFAQQWEPSMRAQEAELQETAKSKLRRLVAYNKAFSCADTVVGDTVLLHKTSPTGKARHVGAYQQKFLTSTNQV